jgi:hypothetical protein
MCPRTQNLVPRPPYELKPKIKLVLVKFGSELIVNERYMELVFGQSALRMPVQVP